jgi:hypothetical protein
VDISSISHKHEFGRANIYSVEDNVLIVDSYDDQYSVHWSTHLDPIRFLSLWRYSGAERAPALLMISPSKGLPIRTRVGLTRDWRLRAGVPRVIEGYGQQFFDLIDGEELRELPITLLRLWFRDASVAWQVLPTVSNKSGVSDTSGTIVGVASNRLDYEGLQRYFRATAAGPLVDAGDDLIPRATADLKFPPPTSRSSLTAAFNY